MHVVLLHARLVHVQLLQSSEDSDGEILPYLSVWQPRVFESESHSLYNTKAVLNDAFAFDWRRICKRKAVEDLITPYLQRTNGLPPAVVMDAIMSIMRERFEVLADLFDYYAATGSATDEFTMQLNGFSLFTKDSKIVDFKSKYLKISDLDALFSLVSLIGSVVSVWPPNPGWAMQGVRHVQLRPADTQVPGIVG